ncbi:MAG TPA: LON peptidase substrate-binding domain-containing protein [Terriglobales bacterium]|nr:LON peptidase substrate-binding domain-containing protein [Terriglobales bacterium]
MSSLLPLFPLEAVLLPGMPFPLHIFEPRYKEMIRECLAEHKSFGVVRSQDEGVAEIGCTAEIVAVTKEHPDGKLDIVTQGRQRFEVLEINQERSFLRAEVLYIADEEGEPSVQQVDRAIQLHGEIMQLVGAETELAESEGSTLAFRLAGGLPLDLDFKQALLSMRSEAKRIDTLTTYFETLLPNLRRAIQVRQRAGGNGHVH